MQGNLAQWLEDCFVKDYDQVPHDGRAAEVENCKSRVVRGSSWNGKPWFMRVAARDFYPPVNRNDVVGFRLARK
jgi:formylglycine-generating enzyme required for sulfatase activity